MMVKANFNIDSFKRKILSKRLLLDEDENFHRDAANKFLICPDKALVDYKVIRMQADKSAELRERIIGDASSLSSTAKKESEIAFKEAEKIEHNKIFFDLNDEHIAKHELYVFNMNAKGEASAAIQNVNREKEKLTILDTILTAYADAMIHIVTKIKMACEKYPQIQKQITTTVILRDTGEVLSNPYESSNLSGMIECLYERYRKKTFVSFTNSLIDLISWTSSESESQEPWKTFDRLEHIQSQ